MAEMTSDMYGAVGRFGLCYLPVINQLGVCRKSQ